MTQFPKAIVASSIALAIGLSGCGGGGGDVASIPPPPPTPMPTPTPTPTPTPSPAAATISALASAAAPNASLFPTASLGGPTIQSHSSTVFPLLQSVVSILPGSVAAANTTMTAGATIASTSPSSSYRLDVGNPALGVSNVVLTPSPSGKANAFQADLSGGATAFLDIANAATSNLSWTTYGFWDVHASNNYTNAAFVTGYSTPATAVPMNGTATYRGNVIGEAYHPAAGGIDGVNFDHLSGDVTLQASFGSGSITGDLTNMITTGFEGDTAPWNSVSLLGTISGAGFSGTSAATSAPANSGSLSSSATGTFVGMFFGPSAQELGAVWTLHDGTSSAVGSFGATTNPSCLGCWDY
jgi:hypothetical protein